MYYDINYRFLSNWYCTHFKGLPKKFYNEFLHSLLYHKTIYPTLSFSCSCFYTYYYCNKCCYHYHYYITGSFLSMVAHISYISHISKKSFYFLTIYWETMSTLLPNTSKQTVNIGKMYHGKWLVYFTVSQFSTFRRCKVSSLEVGHLGKQLSNSNALIAYKSWI